MPQIGHVYQEPTASPFDFQRQALQDTALKQEVEGRALTLQAAVEQRRAQMAQAKALQQQDEFLRSAVSRHMKDGRPDWDGVIDEAYQADPMLGKQLEDRRAAENATAVKSRLDEIKLERENMTLGLQLLDRMVDPQSFAAIAPQLQKIDPHLAQMVGPQFDPARIASIKQGGLSEDDRLKRSEAYYGKDPVKGLLFDLAHSESPDEWGAAWEAANSIMPSWMSGALQKQFGQDTPENRKKLLELVAAHDADTDKGATSDYARFLDRFAKEKGKTAKELTASEELAARKQFGQADDAARRPLAPIVIQTAAGPMVTTGPDRQSVAPVLGPDGKPVSPMPTSTQRDRQAGMGTANVIIASIDELSKKINVNQGALAKVTGAIERAKAQANLNDDISEYNALISGFVPLLARAVGHTGVLTEQDVQSVKKMLPEPGDSQSVRDRKMNRIHTIMSQMPGGGGATGPKEGDIKPLNGPGYPPDAAQQFKNGQWVRIR